MYGGEKKTIYIEFGTISGFRHPLGGVLKHLLWIRGGLLNRYIYIFNFPNHWINIMESSKIRVDYLGSPNG